MELTGHQWNYLVEFIPAEELQRGSGRPWADARTMLNGVLWILRTGAQWADLPQRYGAPATVHRRFQKWRKDGVFRRILEVLADHLHREGRLDLSECFIDGTFAPAKRGGSAVGPAKRGKGTKIMGMADAHGYPVAVCVESASPGGVKLAVQTVRSRFTSALPQRLIGDKAYDSNPLDAEMAAMGIRTISPNRTGTRRTRDGRELRRYQRRWKVERLFSWLGFSRRLTVSYERYIENCEELPPPRLLLYPF